MNGTGDVLADFYEFTRAKPFNHDCCVSLLFEFIVIEAGARDRSCRPSSRVHAARLRLLLKRAQGAARRMCRYYSGPLRYRPFLGDLRARVACAPSNREAARRDEAEAFEFVVHPINVAAAP
jgi:hypothetical protein